ncbi:IS3 family transposase [Larkinella insperata]|uniref:IS3 family transposase n=1 Tax=Larkinella insperata TaxID=332158 RepID=A0ABW3QEN1_9BACT
MKMGRDAFFDLLAANRLLIRRRRRKVITTFSRHRFRKYPNLIKGLVVDRPNQLWVADITYWFTQYGCLYISLVTDAYSKRIMGYAVAPNLQAVNCKNALQMALEQIDREVGKYLIHHSDRGIQYCSGEYVSLLDSYHVQISMTESGDPLENAVAERVNGIIKNEYLAHQPVYSLAQAQAVLKQAVYLYNYKRPHFSCDMLVPQDAHQKEGHLKRRWKSVLSQKQPNKEPVNENPD